MIRSRIINLLLVLLGVTSITLGLLEVIHDPSSIVESLVFMLFGGWCFLGGLRNLRRRTAPEHLPLRTYAAAKWNALAIAILLPACIFFRFAESWLNQLGIPNIVGTGVCISFGVALLAVPVVLLTHRISKAVHNERANQSSETSANDGAA